MGSHQSWTLSSAIDLWASYGFELQRLSSGSYYVSQTYPESVFVVRTSTHTKSMPSIYDTFQVRMKSRESGFMGSEIRLAKGVEALISLVAAWRQDIEAPSIKIVFPAQRNLQVLGRFPSGR